MIYEAPHRVRQTVADLMAALGPHRRVAIARELTKVFEETWRGTLEQAAGHLAETAPRGEYVLVVEGAPPPEPAGEAAVEAALRAELDRGSDRKAAVAAVAHDLRVPKRRVYEVSTRL